MCVLHVKVLFVARVFVHFGQFLIVNYEEYLLATKLADLHALLDEVPLPLALRIVAVNVVLDETVAVFVSVRRCRDLLSVWHFLTLNFFNFISYFVDV